MVQKRPRFPFWKDEKVLGFLTTKAAVRLFIAVVIVAFVAFGYLVMTVFNLAQENKATTQKFQQEQLTRHQDRVKDQASTNAKIRQLYCAQANVVIRLFPNSKAAQNYGRLIKHEYHCNSTFPTSVPKLGSFGGGPAPTPSATPTRTQPSTDAGTAHPLPSAAPTHSVAPKPTPTHHTPKPVPTHKTTSSSKPAPMPKPTPTQTPILNVHLPTVCVGPVVCA